MRTILPLSMGLLMGLVLLGCTGLKEENERLVAENAKLAAELEKVREEAAAAAGKAGDLEKEASAMRGLLATAEDAALEVLKDAEKAVGSPKYHLEEPCKNHQVVKALALAKTRWVVLSYEPEESFRFLNARLVAILDAIVEARAGDLKDFGSAPVVSKALMGALLEYRANIKGTKDWRRKFAEIEKAHREIQPYDGRRVYDLSVDAFYDRGFDKSDDFCITKAGYEIEYRQNGEEKWWSDFWSAEFFFYTFWFRRYLEGTGDVTEQILKLLVG